MQTGEFKSIGQVAAENIAKTLELGEEHVAHIAQAISDEVNAMSSHFSFVVSDMQAEYEKLRTFRGFIAYKWRALTSKI